MLINMDPRVASAFHASNAVSLQNGVSYNMLKVGSKRRRPNEEIMQARVTT